MPQSVLGDHRLFTSFLISGGFKIMLKFMQQPFLKIRRIWCHKCTPTPASFGGARCNSALDYPLTIRMAKAIFSGACCLYISLHVVIRGIPESTILPQDLFSVSQFRMTWCCVVKRLGLNSYF